MLKRRQLIEISDQPWCPRSIRDGITDYLQFVIRAGKVYAPILPELDSALRITHPRQIIDLCSGGGGPWGALQRALAADGVDIPILLTDIHPNSVAFQRREAESSGRIRGIRQSVDVTTLPPNLPGFRTMFSAFHHFRPHEAREILREAVRRKEGIAIFEATRRSAQAIIATALAPALLLLCTPLIRPFRLSRLFWTYVVPAIPMIVFIDGVISCLRTYSPTELCRMASELKVPGYVWRAGERKNWRWGLPITYLIGRPA